MLELTTNQVSYFKDDNMFIGESSELGLSAKYWNSLNRIPKEKTIELTNPKTKVSKIFTYTFSDMNPENEVAGWNYESEEGIKLLIIND